jgi:hypothetical protein
VPTWRGSFTLLCLLGSASSALAQGPDDFLRTFGTITQPATVQATRAAWAKLPSEEARCINNALYEQGGSVEALIQRGVLPSDPRLANARSNCQNQFERQDPQPTGGQSSAYAVSDVALGATVKVGTRHTRSTNALLAINSTDLRGVRKRARVRNGGASLTRHTQFCIRMMESLFTSIAIKSRLSLVQVKPTMTFNDIRARSASPHE